MKATIRTCLLLVMAAFTCISYSQPVTGVWRGRVTKGGGLLKQTYKLELKLVKNGDSITGTSYYYASAGNYYRYTVKGYFGATDNAIHWWDDQLIESHFPNVKLATANSQPLLSVADYNCPGSGVMLLDGHAQPVGGEEQYDLHLQKTEHPDFKDEWDPIIETYFDGGADPYLIDSVGRIAFAKPPIVAPSPTQKTTIAVNPPKENKPAAVGIAEPDKQAAEKDPELVENPWKKETIKTTDSVAAPEKERTPPSAPVVEARPPVIVSKPDTKTTPVVVARPTPLTPEEKFARRKNVLTTDIPISGDTIVFTFYDNAEVDGDSISIFLNGRILYTHIRLTEKGHSIKIPVADLQASANELVMVAENLGSIPPNTAYMEAWSGGKRYTARMESTEGSSAMIRLKRE